MAATLQTTDLPHPKSLYEKILDSKAPLNMVTQVHRLMMVIKLKPCTPGTSDDSWRGQSRDSQSPRHQLEKGRRVVINHLEQYSKYWKDCRRGDALTGVVIFYPDYVVFVMETSAETLTLAMNNVIEEVRRQDVCVAAKVLSYGASIKCRLFKDWSTRIMPPLQTNVQEDLAVETVAHNLPMLVDGILKLGIQLSMFTRVDLSVHVDRLRENFSHLLIPKEHYDYLVSQSEISSVAEYQERYQSRHEIVDDNERTWPAPVLFRPPLKH